MPSRDEATSDELASMRAFVAAALHGAPAPTAPPLELVRRNHLGPLAYRMGVSAFRDEYAASTVMALRRSATLAEVVGELQRHHVRAALIKGIAYAGTIYPDAAERPMNDIDLLVPPRQLADAMRCMLRLGFERVGMSRKLSGLYHALAFNRSGMMVELHRNIVQPYRTSMHPGELWSRATADPLGSGAERLDPIDELLLCIVHVARHELAVPAINYVDVYRSWRRLDETQRALVHERAVEFRIARAVRAVLSMTELLAAAHPGHPSLGLADRVLPKTDAVLRGLRPARLRQIAQKLLLTEGARELAGLGYVYVATYVDGRRRTRD